MLSRRLHFYPRSPTTCASTACRAMPRSAHLSQQRTRTSRRELAPLGRDLFPDALLAAKYANRQLTFFPLDVNLLGSARDSSSATLASRVNGAVSEVQAALMPVVPKKKLMAATSRLVIGAVAALMVRDRLDRSDAEPSEVIEAASSEFQSYFSWVSDLSQLETNVLDEAIITLGHDINYRGLDPAIVSDVYEHAVIDTATRKRLGIFYTPPELARRIAAEVPFEELSPDNRVVVDPACGPTLLLAAQNRLLQQHLRRWIRWRRIAMQRRTCLGSMPMRLLSRSPGCLFCSTHSRPGTVGAWSVARCPKVCHLTRHSPPSRFPIRPGRCSGVRVRAYRLRMRL